MRAGRGGQQPGPVACSSPRSQLCAAARPAQRCPQPRAEAPAAGSGVDGGSPLAGRAESGVKQRAGRQTADPAAALRRDAYQRGAEREVSYSCACALQCWPLEVASCIRRVARRAAHLLTQCLSQSRQNVSSSLPSTLCSSCSRRETRASCMALHRGLQDQRTACAPRCFCQELLPRRERRLTCVTFPSAHIQGRLSRRCAWLGWWCVWVGRRLCEQCLHELLPTCQLTNSCPVPCAYM
jgi:hypothetical protein